MQKNFIAAAIFVSGLVIGAIGAFDLIFMAVGAGLFLVGYQRNKPEVANHSLKEYFKRPKTIVLVVLSVLAAFFSTGRGFGADIATGFAGAALMMSGYLLHKSSKSKKSKGSK